MVRLTVAFEKPQTRPISAPLGRAPLRRQAMTSWCWWTATFAEISSPPAGTWKPRRGRRRTSTGVRVLCDGGTVTPPTAKPLRHGMSYLPYYGGPRGGVRAHSQLAHALSCASSRASLRPTRPGGAPARTDFQPRTASRDWTLRLPAPDGHGHEPSQRNAQGQPRPGIVSAAKGSDPGRSPTTVNDVELVTGAGRGR